MSVTEQEPITEAEVVEEPAGRELVRHPAGVLAVAPQVQAGELVARLDTIRDAMRSAMVEDVDYGTIPGTDKPTLYKPGAEKLAVLFQLDVQYDNEKVWHGDHLTVFSHATVFHQPTGARLGAGEGVCSTREKKYAYRNSQPACPECGKPAVFKSKKDGEGFYCWRKKEGCGAQFPANDQRITTQPAGQVDNPDLADCWNTVVKMAKKRALVDAVLVATAASAIFTQDVEDTAPPPPNEPEMPPLGPVYDDGLHRITAQACVKLAGGQPGTGITLFKLVAKDCGGYMPQAAAIALIQAADTDNLVPDVTPETP